VQTEPQQGGGARSDRDITTLAAKATAAAVAVIAFAFGLWQVRSIVICWCSH
jgi:hypothetical protein